MADKTYTPPKVWTWDKASGGRFANINSIFFFNHMLKP